MLELPTLLTSDNTAAGGQFAEEGIGLRAPSIVRACDPDILQELQSPSFLKPSSLSLHTPVVDLSYPTEPTTDPVLLSHVKIPDTVEECLESFQAYSGARLLLSIEETFTEPVTLTGRPDDKTIVAVLDQNSSAHALSKLDAVQEALRCAAQYPPGYLKAIGIEKVGLFRALLCTGTDGFRGTHPEYPEYFQFNGLTQGNLILVAARPGVMDMTFHHEMGHAIDQAIAGRIDRAGHFERDGGKLDRILNGEKLYPALQITPEITQRLAAKQALDTINLRSIGISLDGGPELLTSYASKNRNELKAELFRLMVKFPSAFIRELISRPDGKTAQACRLLLQEVAEATPAATDCEGWLVALADRQDHIKPQAIYSGLRSRFYSADGRVQVPYDAYDALKRYIPSKIANTLSCFVDLMKVLKDPALAIEGLSQRDRLRLSEDCLVTLEDLGHSFTTGFLVQPSQGLNESVKSMLEDARSILRKQRAATGLPEWQEEGVREFQIIKVERFLEGLGELPERAKASIRRALIRGMASAVWIEGGSGVIVHESGLIITNHHVVPNVGDEKRIIDALGREFKARCIGSVAASDLSLLQVIGDAQFPWMPLAPFDETPAELAKYRASPAALMIGHPPALGRYWEITSGRIVGVRNEMPRAADDSVNLGNVEHEIFTYWGNSGSPAILAADGGPVIGFIHNSYLEQENRRFGISLSVIVSTLKAVKHNSTEAVLARQAVSKLARSLMRR